MEGLDNEILAVANEELARRLDAVTAERDEATDWSQVQERMAANAIFDLAYVRKKLTQTEALLKRAREFTDFPHDVFQYERGHTEASHQNKRIHDLDHCKTCRLNTDIDDHLGGRNA